MTDRPAAVPPAPPLTDAAALRAAGRHPAAPFRVRLADGRETELTVHRLLRVLPGKRVVGEAVDADGARRLVKLFIDGHSERNWQRERDGIAALAAAGVPTPALVAAGPLAGGGHALLTDFLDGADTLLDGWHPLAGAMPGDGQFAAATALLAPAFALLGQAHVAGLSHDDLHFGNFLRHDGRLLLIDGDAVRRHGPGPLAEGTAARDLALLLAQLPRTWDGHLDALLAAYRLTNPRPPGNGALQRALTKARAWRLQDYLGKTGRDCTLFKVERTPDRYSAVVRGEADALAPLLAGPDRAIDAGHLLKRGNTCTVARVEADGRPLVVKRYNIKNARHALSRLWRPSRGWHSWREGHRLRLFGIPTPAPLALVEERRGPLRGRAWLVNEYCAGTDLLTLLDADREPPPDVAAALVAIFATLHRERISHGDLKATNLLWDGRTVQFIDLDAMRQHRSQATHARAWRRDRERLLRNWPEGSALHRWLDAHLPG
ncbi:lipopolysaccharide kinase InaA family protein [Pseudothauera rhizosphaerae]|uniref:Protein kinase domain-containing protein n=1 Tax=Pseudothauera rhizosphaerae TaxID=2565932 RepID=A0A4S4AEU5_9RHOO|nr:lipopolysaccharide kinase InaA family protein [Pseudothauera rhizosphaerae]THF57661.1 hypothetical protein E6O51_17690 [Pseudothauera rhizosphaerae]